MSARRFDVAIVAYENGDAETISSRSPIPDRLALMRALAPDGWVVAKLPAQCGQLDADPRLSAGAAIAWADGWNACRAAMMGEAEAHDARVRSLIEAMNIEVGWRRAAKAHVERLCNALRIAEAAFHRYATSHAAKGTRDGEVKAAANAELARQMRAALDPAP